MSYDENNEPDIEITEDPHDCWKFDSSNCPVMITVNKIGTAFLILSSTCSCKISRSSKFFCQVNK